jgi:hypothetical protein
MKTLHFYVKKPSFTFFSFDFKFKKKRLKKEKPEVLALFADIYKSKGFTVDAAHKAFAGLARKE